MVQENHQNGLESTTLTPSRSTGLVKLLARLQKEDSWFDYNVPPSLRRSYGEEQLLNYLDNTYSQPRFVIDEPKEVLRYAKPGERMVAEKVIEVFLYKIKPGDEGVVTGFENKGTEVNVNFRYENNIRTVRMKREEVQVYGKLGFFGNRLFTAQEMGELKEIMFIDYLVRYIGKETKQKHRLLLPIGAEGIILEIDNTSNHPLHIAWAYHPLSINDLHFNSWWHASSELSLVRPNFIDYQKLRQESFTISDFDQPEENKND